MTQFCILFLFSFPCLRYAYIPFPSYCKLTTSTLVVRCGSDAVQPLCPGLQISSQHRSWMPISLCWPVSIVRGCQHLRSGVCRVQSTRFPTIQTYLPHTVFEVFEHSRTLVRQLGTHFLPAFGTNHSLCLHSSVILKLSFSHLIAHVSHFLQICCWLDLTTST